MMKSVMSRLIALLLFVAIGMKCDGTKEESSEIIHDLQIDAFVEKFRSALSYNVLNGLRGAMDHEPVSAPLAESMLHIGHLLTNKSETNWGRIMRLRQKLINIIPIASRSRRKALSLERNAYMRIYDETISAVFDSLLHDLAREANCSACLAKKCSAVDFTGLLDMLKKAFIFNCFYDDEANPAQITSTRLTRIDCIPLLIVELQKRYQQDIVDITQFYKDEFVKMQVVITLCKFSKNGNATLEVAMDISTEIANIVDFMLTEINYRLDLSWKEEVKSRVMHFMDNRYPSHVSPSNYRTFAYTLWMQISHLGSFDSRYQILVTANETVNDEHKYRQYVTCWKELDCLYIDDLPSLNIVVARHFLTDKNRATEVSKYMHDYNGKLTLTLKELMEHNVGVDQLPKGMNTSLGWNFLVSAKLYHTLVLYSSDGDGCLIHADGRYTNVESHWEISQTINRSECRKVKLFFLL